MNAISKLLGSILSPLNGYKTHIGLAGFGLLGIAQTAGWVDENIYNYVFWFLTTWTGMSVKHAYDKHATKP
jgi:hypothetical protein